MMLKSSIACAVVFFAGVATAQVPPDAAARLAAQTEAMKKLSRLDGAWREVGERIVEGRPPFRFFEMTLNRVGDSAWPAAGAIPPK
jgi:hypothetical protein